MKTLYVRNVPDDVVDRLERLAARQNTSVNAVALQTLSDGSRWVENAALLKDLPSHYMPVEDVVAGLQEDRAAH